MPRHWLRKPKPEFDPTEKRYYVYRLFDANGDLLYIGRSCDPLARLKAHHGSRAEWPSRVVQIEGVGPYTWAEVVHEERTAILNEKPPCNIDGVTKKTGRKVSLAS